MGCPVPVIILPKIVYPSIPVLPSAPTLSQVAGGALSGRTYYVRLTYQTPYGETMWGTEASFVVSANNLLVVTSPAGSSGAAFSIGWNVYVDTVSGSETKQNTPTYIDIGTDWTEPTTGLIAGDDPPLTWGTTLSFLRQPRKVPGFSLTGIRHDNRATSGVQEVVYERTDDTLNFDMEYIAVGSDIAAWETFIESAISGVPFDYYPDATLTPYVSCFMDNKEVAADYRFPGQYKIMKFSFYKRPPWP